MLYFTKIDEFQFSVSAGMTLSMSVIIFSAITCALLSSTSSTTPTPCSSSSQRAKKQKLIPASRVSFKLSFDSWRRARWWSHITWFYPSFSSPSSWFMTPASVIAFSRLALWWRLPRRSCLQGKFYHSWVSFGLFGKRIASISILLKQNQQIEILLNPTSLSKLHQNRLS